MKRILVGYDGSGAADAAIDELADACLPKGAEALVLSVADVWLPEDLREEAGTAPGSGRDLHADARAALRASQETAARGAERVKAKFPGWTVSSAAEADSPGWALVRKAEEFKADLVVVGAHSHSVFERFFFGGVAAKVTAEAPCSVRISRRGARKEQRPLRILVAIDGSAESKAALDVVTGRQWPPLTEFRVATVLAPNVPTGSAAFAREWLAEEFDTVKERLDALAIQAAEKLRAGGCVAQARILSGDPKGMLLSEAEEWKADCVFLGARGLEHRNRWTIGSVASAVSSRAGCSVEIIRRGAQGLESH